MATSRDSYPLLCRLGLHKKRLRQHGVSLSGRDLSRERPGFVSRWTFHDCLRCGRIVA